MELNCVPAPIRKRGNLRQLVEEYLTERKCECEDELKRFRKRSLEATIRMAAGSRIRGKKLKHQWRIPDSVLHAVAERLVRASAKIKRCRDFEQLLQIVTENSIRGFGKLACYDTAHRIGAHCALKLAPNRVYLHCGTRLGAKWLGIDARRPWISKDDLPRELQVLTAADAENFLCVYERQLKQMSGSNVLRTRTPDRVDHGKRATAARCARRR